MLFSSIPFLYYFLPCVLIAYYLVPKSVKNGVLLMASLVFYAWGEPIYVFLMMGSIALGYFFGRLIERFRGTIWAKIGLMASVGTSLACLGYFKYANFFLDNFAEMTGVAMPVVKVALPIGISFYTFQLISYIVDVYRGSTKAQHNPITLATYITMFPQLIAGPIVRYTDVEAQLTKRAHSYEQIAYGIRRFVLGLGKKVLIANVLGEFCAEFRATDEKSIVFYWAYAIAVSLQIYFDFSGYSDMAIGLGSMLGFRFMENFNYPFISKSITEFWRRWHMSLGTWFRDYVYIPLGGSRRSVSRNIFNLFVVWMLTGLWHGAEWTFVVWGLYFGLILMLEKLFLSKWLGRNQWIGHIYVLFITGMSFVLFDSANLGQAISNIAGLFGAGQLPWMTATTIYYLKSYLFIFLIGIFGATPIVKMGIEKLALRQEGKHVLRVVEPIVMILVLILATAYLVDGSFNPFLYFRF